MRIILLLASFVASALSLNAEGSSPFTNGVQIAVIGVGGPGPITNQPFPSANRLLWMAFADKEPVTLWCPKDPSYFVRLTMFDSTGRKIAKTSHGKRYGARFDKAVDSRATRFQAIRAELSYEESGGFGKGGILPPPNTLFEMQNQGLYTLVVEIKAYLHPQANNPSEHARNAFRFPPVKVRIVKPPE